MTFEYLGHSDGRERSSICCGKTWGDRARVRPLSVSNVRAITEIGDYLREGGGKRLSTSAMLLLAAKLLNYKGSGAIRLGAVVEIIHTATLVHDDIIDEAEIRAGRPAPNTIWGNSKCVLAGDWLYMQAFRVSLEERNLHVLDLLTGLTKLMVEGELMQMEHLGTLVSSRENHLDLIYRKTACLFSVCMQLGGVLAGVGTEQRGKDCANMDGLWHGLPDYRRRAGPHRQRAGARETGRQRSA